MQTRLEGTGPEVIISNDGPFIVIGERINPSRRSRLAKSLAEGEMSMVREEATAQVKLSAQVVDVNVSTLHVDQVAVLPKAVQTVAQTVDVPICIDTSNHHALAAALQVCPGKPLVNSVTGEEKSLEAVLPLVKQHKAAVIGLCIDEHGIPGEASRRLEIAQKILEQAQEHGIAPEDVVIDPIAMALGADHNSATVTFEAIRLVSNELAVNTTIGASNVCFGLPERGLLKRSFLTMAIAAGLTSAILDPFDVEIRKTISACDLLTGHDPYALRFVQHSRSGW
jgi:5-methyltetrahydrofolate--homocysteine methyltransferase